MAAPASRNIRDLNGVWLLNKDMSEDFSKLLQLQGVSWIMRQGIAMARISLRTFHQTTDGISTITIHNTSLGGIKGTTEKRVLDKKFIEHSDYIWGHVKGRTLYAVTRDVDDEMKEHWSAETAEGECIVDETKAMNGTWDSIMVWGFELINGSRYFVRHVTVRRGSESASARLVYEYTGATS